MTSQGCPGGRMPSVGTQRRHDRGTSITPMLLRRSGARNEIVGFATWVEAQAFASVPCLAANTLFAKRQSALQQATSGKPSALLGLTNSPTPEHVPTNTAIGDDLSDSIGASKSDKTQRMGDHYAYFSHEGRTPTSSKRYDATNDFLGYFPACIYQRGRLP